MKRHFQYHWWKYLLVVLLPILLWCAVFDAAAKPKQNERLRVLFIGQGLDVQALQDDLSTRLSQMTGQRIKEITVSQTVTNGVPIGELLTARQFSYDLVILAADEMPDAVGQNFFAPLPAALTDRLSQGTPYTETAEDEEISYGFVLSEESRFSAYLTKQDGCIVFFSKESVNVAALNGKGNADDDAAICAAEFLLEESD